MRPHKYGAGRAEHQEYVQVPTKQNTLRFMLFESEYFSKFSTTVPIDVGVGETTIFETGLKELWNSDRMTRNGLCFNLIVSELHMPNKYEKRGKTAIYKGDKTTRKLRRYNASGPIIVKIDKHKDHVGKPKTKDECIGM
ncbi:uncharacterized protein PADG_11776 [Paracoccidioides brasiliensis Pb18]|uniref:Uncharacterized protein n=1 Tax=Paracoccidioides brasiliensis (strain Pb18) TaxID=502780 RepID=A0A0A0HX45_PARBD|nr:uncharacterized protein PADG_11776 [Paracoccidioides brasiliensis Pb18]KGM91990.1 hypothetical protein PADG_11776 [Paracoccidioides brasiliensis Pb18]